MSFENCVEVRGFPKKDQMKSAPPLTYPSPVVMKIYLKSYKSQLPFGSARTLNKLKIDHPQRLKTWDLKSLNWSISSYTPDTPLAHYRLCVLCFVGVGCCWCWAHLHLHFLPQQIARSSSLSTIQQWKRLWWHTCKIAPHSMLSNIHWSSISSFQFLQRVVDGRILTDPAKGLGQLCRAVRSLFHSIRH